MDKTLFAQLVESMEQMGEVRRGERAPSREFHVDALGIRNIRKATGLSQPKFARVLDVDVGTMSSPDASHELARLQKLLKEPDLGLDVLRFWQNDPLE